MLSDFERAELVKLGLTPFFEQQHGQLLAQHGNAANVALARIASERHGEFTLLGARGAVRAALSGRLRAVENDAQRPAVGDWVLAETSGGSWRVVHVLERQSVLRRRAVDGSSRAQLLAANVDLACVVAALTPDGADPFAARHALNPRRIRRYLMTAAASSVPALVLVNKADLASAERAEQALDRLRSELPSVELMLSSAIGAPGLAALRARLGSGTTAVLLGSSGVGKSSLVNALLGHAAQRVGAERQDDAHGRHTTTGRELLRLPTGALLIDTPGMRELALWADDDTEPAAIDSEIEALAEQCRFRDCRHVSEPGCAALGAIEQGTLAPERLAQTQKLERELRHHRMRVDVRLRQEEQRKWRAIGKAARQRQRDKGRV